MPVQINPCLKYDTGYPNKHLVLDTNEMTFMLDFLANKPLIFDFETSGLDWFKKARACGVGLGTWDDLGVIQSYYVPYRHATGESQLREDIVLPWLKLLLEDPNTLKVAHNIKFDEHIARCDGIEVKGPRYDTMVAARLYDENRGATLKGRAVEDLGCLDASVYEKQVNDEVYKLAKSHKMPVSQYRNMYGYSQINIPLCGTYGCFDIEYTGGLYKFYEKYNIANGYKRVWDNEMQLTQVLCDMEESGLLIDVDYLKTLRAALGGVLVALEESVKHQLGGYEFNIASDNELREMLVSKLGIVLVKLTKKGQYAVDKDVLSQHVDTHPVLKQVIDWKEADKIYTTYTQSILDRLDKQNVVHTDFQQVGTYCLAGGELVLTNRGYVPVETVKQGDLVITHTGKAREVTWVGENGLQPIYKTSLENGLTLRTTGNHGYHMFYQDIWVPANRLGIGDLVTIQSQKEEWRKIEGWFDFSVSSWGRVRNDKTGNILKCRAKNKWGHLKVQLYRNNAQTRKTGDRKDFAVHRLVAQAFLGAGVAKETRHLSGFGWENVIENLEWGTSKDNSKDAQKHGSYFRGSLKSTKLDWKAVERIRNTPFVRSEARLGRVGTDRQLASELGVSRELIRDVRLGKRWVAKGTSGKRTKFGFSVVKDVIVEPNLGMTYGLTVAEDCSHVTGGIVTHNTGRLSCRNPNLQNQSADSNDRALKHSGKSLEDGGIDPWSVRRAYINKGEGWVRLLFDYSQIELRVLAFYSRDPVLVDAYLKGEDIHSRTSLEVFGTKEKAKRRLAKVINFGLSYGMAEKGFAAQTGISLADATTYLAKFFERYKGVATFKAKFWDEVRRNGGFFQNIFGRPRRIGNMNSRDDYERGKAERKAIATLIQGTAAELTKESLVRISHYLKQEDLPAYLVSTVHDEIQIDCKVEVMAQVAREVKRLMEDFSMFDPIPIIVDAEYTVTSWADKQKVPL